MKIYLVSDGDYSDYSVKGLFSTKDKAEKFRHHYLFDRIEVHDLDPDTPECVGDRYILHYALETGKHTVERVSDEDKESDWKSYCLTGGVGDPFKEPVTCFCTYNAKDLGTARKIAYDKVMALRAGSTLISTQENFNEMTDEGKLRWAEYACTWRIDCTKVKWVTRIKVDNL